MKKVQRRCFQVCTKDREIGPWTKGHLPWFDFMVHGVNRALVAVGTRSDGVRLQRPWRRSSRIDNVNKA
jgi:hypothetical protein